MRVMGVYALAIFKYLNTVSLNNVHISEIYDLRVLAKF